MVMLVFRNRIEAGGAFIEIRIHKWGSTVKINVADPDPDPLVRSTDLASDPSIIKRTK